MMLLLLFRHYYRSFALFPLRRTKTFNNMCTFLNKSVKPLTEKKTIHVGNNNIIIIVIIIIIITIFTTYKHDKNYYYCTLKRVSGVAVCTMPFIGQWRRNEFESRGAGPERKWGQRFGAKRWKNLFGS